MFNRLYLSLVYCFIYLPIFLLILLSFNQSSYSLIWHGFSLKWYQVLAHDSVLLGAATHSLMIAMLSATAAIILGTIVTLVITQLNLSTRPYHPITMNTCYLILIIIPDIILGIALLIIYKTLHFQLGFWSLLIAHITFCFPFAIVIIKKHIAQLPNHLIEAARDLGAHEWQVLTQIILPSIRHSLLIAWLLCFTLSFDDVIISFFVSGPNYNILPLSIYSMIRTGVKPEINALSTIILILTCTIVMATFFLHKRQPSHEII